MEPECLGLGAEAILLIGLGEGAFPAGEIDGGYIGADAAADDNKMLRINIDTIKKPDFIIAKLFRE